MTSNLPEILTVYDTLQRALAQLQAVDADKIESANLVPMLKAVRAIGAYQAAIDAQIQARAIGNNELYYSRWIWCDFCFAWNEI